MLDAPDRKTLRATLTSLIAPFAPTVQLLIDGEGHADEPSLRPPGAPGPQMISWEHEGFGDSTLAGEYASKRRYRARVVPASGVAYAALYQAVDAKAYRGARIRLRGKLRAAHHGLGQLWMRINRGDRRGFFDNMDDRPVTSTTWQAAEIVATVDTDATKILIGTVMSGTGTAWYDDLELAVEGTIGHWNNLAIKDPGFEDPSLFESWGMGNGGTAINSLDGWRATLDRVGPASGAVSLRVEAEMTTVETELFEDSPAAAEIVDVDLGSGLRARVPISLYSKDSRTIGDDPAALRRSQSSRTASAPLSLGYDVLGGIADLVVMWNALEHFWPYWDMVQVDWNAELDHALVASLTDRSVAEHTATMQKLSAAAPDGHADVTCPGGAPQAIPPFTVDVIEGQVVITATADSALSPGDVVASIDGRPAMEQFEAERARVSGSPQWQSARARQRFGAGTQGSRLTLSLLRGTTRVDVTVTRNNEARPEYDHPIIDKRDDGVYYIDLRRASIAQLDEIMDRLASAPGVVFDMRGMPNANHEILSHLLTREVDAGPMFRIPHIIRPDHASNAVPSWTVTKTIFPVQQPHITGKIAFLVSRDAISYAESVMSVVEHYRLGEIVGSATAGTTGSVAEVTTPTNCRFRFTGMKATRLDGSRFHLLGVQPTIPVARTITGVREGRDEVLDRALAYVRTGAR